MRRKRKQENKTFDIDSDVIFKAMGAWKAVMDTALKTISEMQAAAATAAPQKQAPTAEDMYDEICNNLDELSDEAIVEMHQVMSRHLSKNSTT